METFQNDIVRVEPNMTNFVLGRQRGGSFKSVGGTLGSDEVQGQIGLRLRAVYETIVSEPVPDHFTSLLESLDCSTTKKM